MSWSSPTIHKACKTHTCDLCGEDLVDGGTFKRWVCWLDGHTYAVRVHLLCDRLAAEYGLYTGGRWNCDAPLRDCLSETAGAWEAHVANLHRRDS